MTTDTELRGKVSCLFHTDLGRDKVIDKGLYIAGTVTQDQMYASNVIKRLGTWFKIWELLRTHNSVAVTKGIQDTWHMGSRYKEMSIIQ